MFSGRVMLTDDDRSMRKLMYDILSAHGFVVFSTTEKGLRAEHFDHSVTDVAVVSLRYSGSYADKLLEQCTPFGIPVVILLSSLMEGQRRRFIDMGAAEVLSKPLNITLLENRLHDLMPAQMKKIFEPLPFRVEYGGMGVDMLTQTAWAGGRKLDLKPRELRLLRLFLARHGIVMHRYEISSAAWGEVPDNDRVVDVYVCGLKRALGDEYGGRILTIRGEGYVMTGEND